MCLEKRGGIRRRRVQPHSRPFHCGGAGLREKKEKRGKGGRRKRRRGRMTSRSRTAVTQAPGVTWPAGWRFADGPRTGLKRVRAEKGVGGPRKV
jgi:hypothetical protein